MHSIQFLQIRPAALVLNGVETLPDVSDLQVILEIEVRLGIFDAVLKEHVGECGGNDGNDTGVLVFRRDRDQPEVDDLRMPDRFQKPDKSMIRRKLSIIICFMPGVNGTVP